jgi:3-dehydroquinate dehydratase-2
MPVSSETGPKKVLVIHGPNLNMLGLREPDTYGRTQLADIDSKLVLSGTRRGLTVQVFQSNHEGAIIDKLHSAMGTVDGLIINPAAYTHTSIAIRDALAMLSVPIIEVHLSNIHKREAFRHTSLMAALVTGQIVGLGVNGYYLALQALADILETSTLLAPDD